ncbi:MAG: carboxymuconolactone decarboxylase family protein [Nitrospirota bacterium]
MSKLPGQYRLIKKRYSKLFDAVGNLGRAVRDSGPIDEKTSQLIQLAASAAMRSEGSVHSHARRAVEAGATIDEVRHSVILLTSTIGFPTVSAALSWVDDVLKAKKKR